MKVCDNLLISDWSLSSLLG